MVNAPQTVFYETPKAFDGVGMNISDNVDLRTVIDPTMGITPIPDVRNAVVAHQFIGEHRAFRQDMFADHGKKNRARRFFFCEGPDFAATFDQSDYHRLVLPVVAASNPASPA